MFAILSINGKQYKVSEGDTIFVDKLTGEEGSKLTFDTVHLVADEKTEHIGTPFVPNAKVKATLLSHVLGEKMEVRRYKKKVRYRKEIGFRPHLSKVSIDSILIK